MSEHRRESRLRTFLKGRIIFNKGASTMDCLVRDLSASGARLALTETTTLPESFDLYIPQKDRTYRSTLCWRREDGIGVTFTDSAGAGPARPDPAATEAALRQRIAELEAENAALRRLLGGMAQPSAA